MRAMVVLSGGMDSVTLLAHMSQNGYYCDAITFNYGQRHVKEIESARYFAQKYASQHFVIDISSLSPLFIGSALTDDFVAVPHGHYEEESMKQTVVPNRNAIMLAIAWAAAQARGYHVVATAVHAGDHAIYPDCRPPFIEALNAAFRIGTEGHRSNIMHLHAPFLMMDKAHIAGVGKTLDIEYHRTWTCYEGGDIHCGQCGACVERQEAFDIAGVDDHTKYKEEYLPF